MDIEKIRTEVKREALAWRFFSANEYQAVRQYADPVRAFYTLWTKKQAVLKATGVGLATGLREFDVATQCKQPEAVKRWQFTNIGFAEGYVATLAADGGEFTSRAWEIDPHHSFPSCPA